MVKRKQILLTLMIITSFFIAITPVNSTINGSTPPNSGDWIINEPTTVEGETLLLNGSIIVNNTLTVANSIPTFNDSYGIEITENGSLTLKNVTITTLDPSKGWYLLAQYGSKIIINNCTFLNVGIGFTDGSEYGSITVKTNNAYINNTNINNALTGIYIRNANNVTIRKVEIHAVGSFALRISNSANIKLTEIGLTAVQNGLLLIETRGLSIDKMDLEASGLGFDFYYGVLKEITVNNSKIVTNYGNAFWNNEAETSLSNLTLVNIEVNSGQSALDLSEVENITVRNATLNANNAGLSFDSSRYIYINQLSSISRIGVLFSNVTNVRLLETYYTSDDIAIQVQNSKNICIQQVTVFSQNNGIAFYDSTLITVKNGILSSYNVVARVYNVTKTLFNNTVISTPNIGLAMEQSSNVTLTRFHVLANKTLLIGESNNITIEGSSSYSGFEPTIWNSTKIHVVATIFISNYTSLILDNVTYSEFVSNSFTSMLSFGLRLVRNSSHNIIMGNNFLFSKGEGLYIKNGTGNLIYLNYFIMNNDNKTQVIDLSFGNNWDNGTIGNYYFDYNGSDLNHDGIGDQPYKINQNTFDHYPIVIDNDHDGINDAAEILYYSTNPNKTDTDNDGISDGEEIFQYGTNPLSNDTDGDGMTDGWEITNGLNPLVNDSNIDSDNDGLTNLQEYNLGTNPKANDTDGDGMPDGWEVNNGLNPLVNDASQDPDNDGLTNAQEYELGTNPKANDTDNDGLIDGEEVEIGTDPLKADTDGDGLSDGQEIAMGLNPLNADTDGDGDIDSTDPLPTINNYVLIAAIVIIVIGAIGVFFYWKKMKS